MSRKFIEILLTWLRAPSGGHFNDQLYIFRVMKTRCSWCGEDPLYIAYHDEEWGVPVKDDATLFEFLTLETFQAGLSWITVLRKRENFRKAFDNFDYKKIANYTEEKIDSLLQDAGIIRNKLKVRAAVTNAVAFMEVQKEFGSFSDYIWGFCRWEAHKKYIGESQWHSGKYGLEPYIEQGFEKTWI